MDANLLNQPNIVVVGTGYWGKNLVRNFSELGALYGICDTSSEIAQTLANKYNTKSLSWDSVLNSKEVNGIVIATPATSHAKLAKAALQSGKHVFVEKPLALEINEAIELTKLSESLNLRLMAGHLMQYHPLYIYIKQMVQNKELGNLQYVYSTRLNLGRVLSGKEDVMWSFAPHDISMILGIVDDEPQHVNAFGGDYLNKKVADISNIHLSFKNNIKGHVFISWLSPYKEQKLVVVGDKAIVTFDNNQPWDKKLQIAKHDVNVLKSSVYPYIPHIEYINIKEEEPLKNECKHFIDCITKGTTPITDGNESIKVLNVLTKASTSLYT